MTVTAYSIAERFIGTKEVAGVASNPLVLAMLHLDEPWPTDDATPWCSAFLNFICWLLNLPRSKSLAARSWLAIGTATTLAAAKVGFDIVVLSRGVGDQPGPEVLDAPGHVGLFAGLIGSRVAVLAGNQGDAVSLASFPVSRVLAVRRLA